MKTLTCKMCGSTHLVKNDDMYLCQSCGTKYVISDIEDNRGYKEEIDEKRLTEKVDNQEELKRLHILVKDDPSLYNRIYELDLGDWQAYFYCKIVENTEYESYHYFCNNLNSYLVNTLTLLKERISSDSERQYAIKNVIFEFFKQKIYEENSRFQHGNYSYEVNFSKYKPIFDISMDVIENGIKAVFGAESEYYSNFINTLKNEYNSFVEQLYKETSDSIKEENIRFQRMWEESISQKKERMKKSPIWRIGIILILLAILAIIFCV